MAAHGGDPAGPGRLEVRRAAAPGGHAGAELAVVAVDGRDVGRFWLQRRPGVLELSGLDLLPAWRSRGVGAALLRDLRAEARREGRRLELEVEPDNCGARRFYERQGMVAVPGSHPRRLRYTDAAADVDPGPDRFRR